MPVQPTNTPPIGVQRSDMNSVDAHVSQDQFTQLLFDPEQPCPEGLISPTGKPDNKRLNVYRNNVVSSILEVMGEHFFAIRRLLGDENFKILARNFISQTPPQSPVLSEYGVGFAEFIRDFEPLKSYPYMEDVARLERLWLDSFHSADVEIMSPDALGAVAPDDLANLRFEAHPAAYLLKSRYAAVSIFSVNRQQLPMDGIDLAAGEFGLITRPHIELSLIHI